MDDKSFKDVMDPLIIIIEVFHLNYTDSMSNKYLIFGLFNCSCGVTITMMQKYTGGGVYRQQAFAIVVIKHHDYIYASHVKLECIR